MNLFLDNNAAATDFSSEQRVVEKVVRNGQVLRDVDYTVFRRPHQMMVVTNRPVSTTRRRRPRRRSSNKKGKGFKKKNLQKKEKPTTKKMRPIAASEKRGTNNVLEWIVAWIRVFYYRLMWRYFPSFLLNKKNHSVPEAVPAIVLPEDVYKTQRKDRFFSWFRGGAASADANLDAIFTQSYAEYWKEVQVKDNLLEQRWRRRLLIESTPRGNVIMYYDAFKRGFAYYADTFMPYGLLNAVAMKYVMTYSCRSFFVDEEYFGDDKNHLIRLEREQDDGDDAKDGDEKRRKNKRRRRRKVAKRK